MDILFPHAEQRPVQQDIIAHIISALQEKKSAVIHAPTGIGKTAAVLSPIITHALEHKLTVFYLTSRHTQHKIVLDTVEKIMQKTGTRIICADMLGKRWMCLQPNATKMRSQEFSRFCSSLIENQKCEHYMKARTGMRPTPRAAQHVDGLLHSMPQANEHLVAQCREDGTCPYEIGIMLAEHAHIIIGDYSYIFNTSIREKFLARIKRDLANSIIIADEGHNLPSRLREQLSDSLSNVTISRALKEANDTGSVQAAQALTRIENALNRACTHLHISEERLCSKEEFLKDIGTGEEIEKMKEALLALAKTILESKHLSAAAGVHSFLENWDGQDIGYARIARKERLLQNEVNTLLYNCLDPSLASKDAIAQSHSTFIMSATLHPPEMYKDLLGFPQNAITMEYTSPFPKKNKLNLIIPLTTTQYQRRSEEEYDRIAAICTDIAMRAPGCTGIFLPSYSMLASIAKRMRTTCAKTLFEEKQGLQKNEKEALLKSFSSYKKAGAVLLGVSSASFAEGIDLPGVFSCVIVVGIPLQPPDLETQELIKYYDTRFGRGKEYGYILPAFIKTVQSAGRCIRSEKDRGVLVFLDERYAWPSYIKYFPAEWDLAIRKDYKPIINAFFLQEQEAER